MRRAMPSSRKKAFIPNPRIPVRDAISTNKNYHHLSLKSRGRQSFGTLPGWPTNFPLLSHRNAISTASPISHPSQSRQSSSNLLFGDVQCNPHDIIQDAGGPMQPHFPFAPYLFRVSSRKSQGFSCYVPFIAHPSESWYIA